MVPMKDGQPDKQYIKDKYIEMLSRSLDVEKEKLFMSTRYCEDLDADELDQVELVMALQKEFEVNIPDDSEGRNQTIGDSIVLIAELKGIHDMRAFVEEVHRQELPVIEEQKRREREEYERSGFFKRLWLYLTK